MDRMTCDGCQGIDRRTYLFGCCLQGLLAGESADELRADSKSDFYSRIPGIVATAKLLADEATTKLGDTP